ncbi:MAG: phosphonoacetaldehyde hydrolase [Anaerolineae bacterium]|jgi:phosphonoacetaldehyde hydrolase|nr:phosphonoacetaldehyde hydrolase [Anaerolineae bacterium]
MSDYFQAVILDWAGTTVDYGCLAPAQVFIAGFAAHGVRITMDEARAPMGRYKRDHIAAILAQPAVAQRWQAAHGRPPADSDVAALFADFVPRQMASLAQHSDLIPGVVETVAALRAAGYKIGSCTGYTRAMMEIILPLARAAGYAPDALVCPDEVPAGRPAPWMCFQNAMQLNVYPMSALVKIGDTPADMAEGRNAGMWTIGLAKTGNELGLSLAEVTVLPRATLTARLAAARARLLAAGAHEVVDGLADIMPALERLHDRHAAGEKP